jgi:hypothetical protein
MQVIGINPYASCDSGWLATQPTLHLLGSAHGMQTVSSVLILTRMPRMTCRVALAAVLLCAAAAAALGGKRAPIPDDLRDVIDDEEDDEWRRYGAPPSRGPGRGDGPPPDLSRMDPAALQDELLRGQTGPSFGFVKLRPGTAGSRVRIP